MKKTLLILVVIFTSILSVNSQSYKIIGSEPWVDAIFYFEVTDSYDGAEMQGIRIELLDRGRLITAVYTNHQGRALIMFKGVSKIEDNMSFKIQKENYSIWRHNLSDQWDVLEYMEDNQIGIWYKDYRGLRRLKAPTSRPEDIRHLLNGNFKKASGLGNSYSGKGPGMMHFRVSLEYRRHPKNQQYHNVEGSSGYSQSRSQSNYNQQDNTGDPFQAMAEEDGADSVYKGWVCEVWKSKIYFKKNRELLELVLIGGEWKTFHTNSNGIKRFLGKYNSINGAGWRLKRYMDNN